MDIRDRFRLDVPVGQAGMGGGLAGATLAAAVAEAGGLGTIGIATPRQLGGFNWSTQHLDFSEVCDGVWEAAVGGSWLSGSDSLAGTADGGLARRQGPVLGGDRCGGDDRGGRRRGARGVAGGGPVVPPAWGRAAA